MTVTDDETFTLVIFFHLIVFFLVALLSFKILPVFLCPFIFAVHIIVDHSIIFSKWLSSRYDSTFFVKVIMKSEMAILNDYALFSVLRINLVGNIWSKKLIK